MSLLSQPGQLAHYRSLWSSFRHWGVLVLIFGATAAVFAAGLAGGRAPLWLVGFGVFAALGSAALAQTAADHALSARDDPDAQGVGLAAGDLRIFGLGLAGLLVAATLAVAISVGAWIAVGFVVVGVVCAAVLARYPIDLIGTTDWRAGIETGLRATLAFTGFGLAAWPAWSFIGAAGAAGAVAGLVWAMIGVAAIVVVFQAIRLLGPPAMEGEEEAMAADVTAARGWLVVMVVAGVVALVGLSLAIATAGLYVPAPVALVAVLFIAVLLSARPVVAGRALEPDGLSAMSKGVYGFVVFWALALIASGWFIGAPTWEQVQP